MNTNLIIIGSGPGGYRAAEYAARHGLSVVVVESDEIGGTCLNYGCIPTKTFCHNAEIIDSLRDAETYGLDNLQYTFDFTKVAERKKNVVQQLQNGIETLFSSLGITFIKGFASFKDQKTIIVDNKEYTADNIIIATGSHAKRPPINGIELKNVVTSKELLDIQSIPKRLCIIGAGVIGMEFASAFCSFGCEVTVIEFLKEALPSLDSDIAKRLRQTIAKRGVSFFMQSAVTGIQESENGHLIVSFDKKGKSLQTDADMVLIATGRTASIENLGLDKAGIEYTRQGITVNNNFETNVPGIYAIGDVNGCCMLAHAATFQGIHAVNNILGIQDGINLRIMPSAVFTNPEAGSVGLSEDQCKAQNIEYICKKGLYRSNGRALANNTADGVVKLLSDTNGKIIGCHIYGSHASDMIQEISTLMCRDTTISQLREMVHIHPTLSEILQGTAEQF